MKGMGRAMVLFGGPWQLLIVALARRPPARALSAAPLYLRSDAPLSLLFAQAPRLAPASVDSLVFFQPWPSESSTPRLSRNFCPGSAPRISSICRILIQSPRRWPTFILPASQSSPGLSPRSDYSRSIHASPCYPASSDHLAQDRRRLPSRPSPYLTPPTRSAGCKRTAPCAKASANTVLLSW